MQAPEYIIPKTVNLSPPQSESDEEMSDDHLNYLLRESLDRLPGREKKRPKAAPELLREAASILEERGVARDLPNGERSMDRTVKCFLALKPGGRIETELDGWTFMMCLKLARATAGKPNLDDWMDQAGYSSLGAECLLRELQGG